MYYRSAHFLFLEDFFIFTLGIVIALKSQTAQNDFLCTLSW